MPSINTYRKSYNSFSGVDMKAVFGSQVIGTLQAISYSIQREKAPIYTMGGADPRAFSRGKRGIAGTLIFIEFDKHALLNHSVARVKFSADNDEIAWEYAITDSEASMENAQLQLVNQSAAEISATTGTFFSYQTEELFGDDASFDQQAVRPWYVDQIPPFDITLLGANEYGATTFMKIIGVEVLNEGSGISIDDLVTEMQMQYVARQILPWTAGDPTPESIVATEVQDENSNA